MKRAMPVIRLVCARKPKAGKDTSGARDADHTLASNRACKQADYFENGDAKVSLPGLP